MAILFLGGHHLYMNLCPCVLVCVCPENCAFLRPPLVRFSVPQPLCASLTPQGDWDTGTLGQWDNGWVKVRVPTYLNYVS